MTKQIFYPEATRGHTEIDWLNARHSFNFARFQDPQRNPFGALVILNEDTIAPGKGFGTHGHQNMEIISVILEGKVRHIDSMGNEGFINEGEAQIISAGAGITHSEFNYYDDRRLKLLQIWIRPERTDITPQYAQMPFDNGQNGLLQILSPDGENGSLRMNQRAWVSFARMSKDESVDYQLKRKGNGAYVYLISGILNVLQFKLSEGDAIGITGSESFNIAAENDALAIIIDVPID